MKAQLLYFQSCPNIEAARDALRQSLAAEGMDVAVEEIDVEDPSAPEWARGWGSPTILINGKDVNGQDRSEASACRIYPGGAPSVETLRARIASERAGEPPLRRSAAWPMVGAVTAAIGASACCLIPAVLGIVGASGAGFATRFAPYRPYFLVATGVALALGFWFAYRRQADACGCAVRRGRKAARVVLWITTVVVIALAAYPRFSSGSATAGSTEETAKATLHLRITGMDCAECTGTIASRIKKLPGVVSASVDFESGLAVVRYDGRDGMEADAIEAVKKAGFRAEAQP